MNRAAWFRLLQVAVVAPYLYHLSGKQDGYFNIGLKLVAGSLIAMNIAPLIQDAKNVQVQAKGFLQQVAKAQETLAKTQRVPTTIEAEDAEVVG